jgi:hypothetical protein
MGAAWHDPVEFRRTRSSSNVLVTSDDVERGSACGLRLDRPGGLVLEWERAARLDSLRRREGGILVGAEF